MQQEENWLVMDRVYRSIIEVKLYHEVFNELIVFSNVNVFFLLTNTQWNFVNFNITTILSIPQNEYYFKIIFYYETIF